LLLGVYPAGTLPVAAHNKMHGLSLRSELQAPSMNQELKYPRWQELLKDLILEFNPQNLPPKLRKTEAIIRARYREVSCQATQTEERQALIDALATIQVIKGSH